ncbi:hypothetical protein BDN67DRAFT_808953, partial [Paxillus ammoniavirescens]
VYIYPRNALSLTPAVSKTKIGVDKGPIHLVEAGLINQLEEIGWKVNFDGHHQFEEIQAASDPPIGKLKNPRLVSRVCESVERLSANMPGMATYQLH